MLVSVVFAIGTPHDTQVSGRHIRKPGM